MKKKLHISLNTQYYRKTNKKMHKKLANKLCSNYETNESKKLRDANYLQL